MSLPRGVEAILHPVDRRGAVGRVEDALDHRVGPYGWRDELYLDGVRVIGTHNPGAQVFQETFDLAEVRMIDPGLQGCVQNIRRDAGRLQAGGRGRRIGPYQPGGSQEGAAEVPRDRDARVFDVL